MQPFRVNLNPRAVAAPVQRIATTAAQVIAASTAAFHEAELRTPSSGGSVVYQFSFGNREPTSDERRSMYENWLLSKGVQDLARGVRESLEAAFVYITLMRKAVDINDLASLNAEIIRARKRAQSIREFPFPKLIRWVNDNLISPMALDSEMCSLQAIRNCLEHRGGIVGEIDLKDGKGELTLIFTRRRMFYKLASGEEVECLPSEKISNPQMLANAPIMLGATLESRSFRLGETVKLNVVEFNEIAINCGLFGDDLVAKLPLLLPQAS